MIRIRHRTSHDLIADVSDDQTPHWFIGADGTTYGKDQWELLPPPGTWEDVTAQVVMVEMDKPAQGRVNFYFNEAGTHAIRIGYLQFKGLYRLAHTPTGFKVERRIDTL